MSLDQVLGWLLALFVDLSVREIFDLAKVPVRFLESPSYLTGGVAATRLRWHLSNMKVAFHRQPVFWQWWKIGKITEDIGLVILTTGCTIWHNRPPDTLGLIIELTDNALRWVESYPRDKTLTIQTGSITSKFVMLKYGVPQGSMVVLILFPKCTTPLGNNSPCTHCPQIHFGRESDQNLKCTEETPKWETCLVTTWNE